MPHIHTHHLLKTHHNTHNLSVFIIFILFIAFFTFFTILINPININNPNKSIPTTIPDHIIHKLRLSVTFLPLKDLRFSHIPLQGHTWFMSSLYDTHQQGQVQFQKFPSQSSQNRLLCLMGRDTHDGSWNSYALAWPDALPYNSTFMPGLTFVSYNHYSYENLWHGLSALVPFVAWHRMNNCSRRPARWVLYHWGELRLGLGPWVRSLMEATFDGPVNVEGLGGAGDGPVCFEEAVVMRHNEGGMWREKRMEVYDLMRCKARIYCGVGSEGRDGSIGMTLFLRRGARSFKNQSVVEEIFRRECGKVEGCRFMVAHSNNLTFCDQVKVMSKTDILISPHGAQLTNLFLMDRNSSVMEFFPKGWLKLAGVGQYVYHWIASWSGMNHHGAWRDPNGDHCPYNEDDRRCMSIYKSGRIGHNRTYFAEWARNVLALVNSTKMVQTSFKSTSSSPICNCAS
ncbi:putative glycosyltransferase 61 [Senna tora]|uniref:Putative glycosyltransferase 61 n=1 Tax=Senna tora TaxID=362788 RepID=A0A834XFH5_9FABA|nr:putative glycosyltransferase 61 [Senna tora]